MTAEELYRLPRGRAHHELVHGELRTTDLLSAAAGAAAAQLIASLAPHTEQAVYAGVGFQIAKKPDTVRAPAVAVDQFADPTNDDFIDGAPEVAFEFACGEIEEKTADWLRAGTRAVVIIDPSAEIVSVHRASGVAYVKDAIELPDIISGWRLPLSELFD
jgi:Putative restriction endonuclease